MSQAIKKIFLAVLVIAVYFGIWRDVRGYVTQNFLIPLVEHAKDNSNNEFYFNINKTTSTSFYILDINRNEYDRFLYTTPAGFYFLIGLLFVILFNGKKIHLALVIFYNLFFWITSTLSIWFGLYYYEPIFHFSQVGGRYFTPAFTFIILALLISPKFREKIE